jgi:hypothetical protein
MKRTGKAVPLAALALAASSIYALSGYGDGQAPRPLRGYMRQKLDHAKDVLDGLAVEDFTLIARSARAMRQLSEDAKWRVSPNVRYLRLSAEFRELADELAAKAKEKNLDGATLAFVKLAMNCVNCHKLVRDERLMTLVRRDKNRARSRA